MPLLEQVFEQYPEDVKMVVENFPLRSHKFTVPAALASLAAERQGKYWEYHDLLFKNYNKINDQKIIEFAKVLKLDMKKFQNDMKDPELRARVNQDMRDGQKAGVRGTPTVFINGKRLQNLSLAGFKAMIEPELTGKKGSRSGRSTPKSRFRF